MVDKAPHPTHIMSDNPTYNYIPSDGEQEWQSLSTVIKIQKLYVTQTARQQKTDLTYIWAYSCLHLLRGRNLSKLRFPEVR